MEKNSQKSLILKFVKRKKVVRREKVLEYFFQNYRGKVSLSSVDRRLRELNSEKKLRHPKDAEKPLSYYEYIRG
jgi:hypothetical protein